MIRLRRSTREELRRLKTHPRETYDDVIRRLLNEWRVREPHSEGGGVGGRD